MSRKLDLKVEYEGEKLSKLSGKEFYFEIKMKNII